MIGLALMRNQRRAAFSSAGAVPDISAALGQASRATMNVRMGRVGSMAE